MRADALIRAALEEDVTGEDVSTASVLPDRARQADLCKQAGVIAGLPVFARAFRFWTHRGEVFRPDGDRVEKGSFWRGDGRHARHPHGERTALNFCSA